MTETLEGKVVLQINLTAPFLLSQAFAKQARADAEHFPDSISKAALASITQSMALARDLIVNGLALGAILSPSNAKANPDIIKKVPLQRWALQNEVEETLLFLLSGPAYITGEIIHVDGGRHLV